MTNNLEMVEKKKKLSHYRSKSKMAAGYQTHLYIYGDHSLSAIELKATPNGNPTNDFCWRQKSSSLKVVQCNTTSRPITIHRPNLYSLIGKI